MDKKRYSAALLFVTYVVVLGIIITAFYNFASSGEKRIFGQNMQYVRDSAVRSAERVDTEISEGLSHLSYLCGVVSRSMTSPEVDYEKIRSMSEDTVFDFIEFVDAEGMNHNVTGGISDAHDRHYYIDGIRGNTGIEVVFNSRATHETLLDMYVPVMYNEQPCGVLVGVFQAKNRLTKLLSVDLFGEPADTFLINPDGRVVASNHEFDTSLELTISTIAGSDHDASNAMKIAIENGNTAGFTLGERAGCITKLDKSGWFLMQLFPQAAAQKMVNDAFTSGVKLEIAIIVVLTLTGIFMVFFSRRSRKVIETTTDELTGYKNAVLADAIITFDADITNNSIAKGAWKGASGRMVPPEELVGITLPCSYDEYIQKWAEKFVHKDYREMFLKATSRDNLMQSIAQGKSEVSIDYAAKAVDGTNIFARRSIFLAHNNKGSVIAYCSVKNITEQHRRDEQMLQYEKMLATVASVTYKGIRVIELENYTCTYLSFENGGITEQEIGSWTVWLARQRVYVHPDDYEALRSAVSENALEQMKPNTDFSIDYRSAACDEQGRHRIYRTTVFKTDSSGKEYVYLVTVDTTDEVKKAGALTT
ncbi:MAG: hypothetical protein ACI4KM_05585 [Oscillospiraceae bacterium]